jgi:hypothetical protein
VGCPRHPTLMDEGPVLVTNAALVDWSMPKSYGTLGTGASEGGLLASDDFPGGPLLAAATVLPKN